MSANNYFMVKDIELVEYSDQLAAGIKDMWDDSVDSWNGENHVTTEKAIIDTENNSPHLHLTLAKSDQLITGYCKLSIDHQDSGALYIDLLNVRDSFHGKKIGKELVKDAVEKTVKLGWPRVDLHTWDGNLKAVPLYKKCGFFWEKRDGDTHLINLIPTVLQTELFENYFKSADWYNDNIREIKVEPDIKEENKFNVWTYNWDNSGDKLAIDFIRRGRGIKRVETNDYLIDTTVEAQTLVFGKKYKINYKIVNKSGKELNIKLKGEDDKHIKFDLKESFSVIDIVEIQRDFFVDEVMKSQSEWQTHPGVVTNVEVNNKKVLFKTGVISKSPLTGEIKPADNPFERCYKGIKSKYFLDIQNQCKDKVLYKIELPFSEDIIFKADNLEFSLKEKEKLSIPVDIVVNKSCFYVGKIDVKAIYDSGEEFDFQIEINNLFNLGYGSYSGESKNDIIAGFGNYFLCLSKEYNNTITFTNCFKNSKLYIMPAKLGLPFSSEFENRPCNYFKTEVGDGWIILKLNYRSQSFNGVEFNRVFKLFSNGVLERWIEVESSLDHSGKELFISDNVYYNRCPSVFKYNDKIITLDQDNSYNMELWDCDNISENWIFTELDGSNLGINWSNSHTIKYVNGSLTLISSLGSLDRDRAIKTDPITITFDTFKEWTQFREFSLQKNLAKEVTCSAVEFEINKKNPFIEDEAIFKIISNNGKSISGNINYSLDNSVLESKVEESTEHQIVIESKQPLSILSFSFTEKERIGSFYKAIFLKGKKEISLKLTNDIHTVDNGVLEFKTAKDFGPALFSLKYCGEQWLDSNYPEVTAKSWWNPWVGGLFTFPENYSLNSLLNEKSDTNFVEKLDNKGNRWAGLKITIKMMKDEDKRGFEYSQYYLTLPGSPVLMTYNEFIKEGEFSNVTFVSNNFFKGKDLMTDKRFEYINRQNSKVITKAGVEGMEGETKGYLNLYDEKRKDHIIHICDSDSAMGYYLNKHISMVWFANSASAKSGTVGQTEPNFMVFSDIELKEGMLDDLKGLKII